MGDDDERRRIPRTDRLLELPAVARARQRLGEAEIRAIIAERQRAAREGSLPVAEVEPAVERALSAAAASTLRPVLNATGVIVHTNLGRAPLSDAAREAVLAAAGYADIEMDLGTGKRSARGAGAREALLRACPAAEDALIVNNGAAALLLAVTACGPAAPAAPATASAPGQEIVVSRGELVEIGAGFRLPELMETTGARLREVGATNRTHPADYLRALGPATRCVLKVHPSNFRVDGFTSDVGVARLRELLDADEAETGRRIPLVVDLGSGLLAPDPLLPDEPDIDGALRAGADAVIVSGDKLLGGPQAGLLLGRRETIERLRTHPLARAVRSDKLTLAGVEATLRGGRTPVQVALHADPERLRERAEAVATRVSAAADLHLTVVPHDGRVGGGGAPGVPLPGWAVELPEVFATRLRLGTPAVVGRVHQERCLIDLRCVDEEDDEALAEALVEAAQGVRAEARQALDPNGERPLKPYRTR